VAAPLAVDVLRVGVPLAVGGLAVVHPGWADGAVAQGVATAGRVWVPLHLVLIVGYLALVWTLDVRRRPVRLLLSAFAACNTTYLAVDGVAVGMLAQTDPAAADAVWNSPAVDVLANLAGATWAAALLAVAAARGPGRSLRLALAVVWLLFVAGSRLPYAGAASRVLALGIGAAAVYARGASGLGFALLVLAGVTRQHVGPEAAFGMLCLALAALVELRAGARSARRA
jgi:hypothetical protein